MDRRAADGRDGRIAAIVAAKIGYPTSATDPFAEGGLVRLSRPQAARVLAVAGATSLAHGRPAPRRGWIDAAERALGDLADDATLLGNGLWEGGASQSWSPLSGATFDCGVIGFDAANAFIFWVEEED